MSPKLNPTDSAVGEVARSLAVDIMRELSDKLDRIPTAQRGIFLGTVINCLLGWMLAQMPEGDREREARRLVENSLRLAAKLNHEERQAMT